MRNGILEDRKYSIFSCRVHIYIYIHVCMTIHSIISLFTMYHTRIYLISRSYITRILYVLIANGGMISLTPPSLKALK
jgi:hypothetical protein